MGTHKNDKDNIQLCICKKNNIIVNILNMS